MRYAFLFLLVTLLVPYGLALWRIVRSASGLNALLGWWVGMGYFVVAPLTIMTVAGGYEMPSGYEMGNYWREVDFNSTRFLIPYGVIWVSFLAASLVIYLFVPPRPGVPQSGPVFSRKRIERVLLVTSGLILLDWLLTIRALGGVEAFFASHWYNRGEDFVAQLGDSFVLLEHLSMANQVIFTSAAALYTGIALKTRNVKTSRLFAILLVLTLQMIMTGNRIYLATYLVAVLVQCVLCQRKKVLVALLAVTPLLVLVFSAWAAVRHDLTDLPNSVDAYQQADFGNRTTSVLVDVTEGMDLLLLFHVIRDFGHRFDYLFGASYSRALLSFIPRRLYPGKPETFTGYLAKLYVPNVLTSLNVTALGELYANFGPAALLLFPLLTGCVLVLTMWSTTREGAYGLLSPILFTLMFWTARSTLEDSIVLLVLALLLSFCFRLQKGLCILARG